MAEQFLTGLTAFPLTPADADGRVRTEELGTLVSRLVDTNVSAIGVLGSTGIQAYLSRFERQRAVRTAVEAANGAKPVMVGVGAMRTDEACALALDAKQAGADWLVLSPISYTPLTQDEAYQHFVQVASQTDLPLCVYANPSTTHFHFSHGLIMRLAALPTIKAIKLPPLSDSTYAAELADLRRGCPSDFSLGYSGDWEMLDALAAGADCFHSALAGLLPTPLLALAAQAEHSDHVLADAFAPFMELIRVNGSLRVTYALANEMGVTTAQPPRPVLPLSAQLRRQCADAAQAVLAVI